MLSVKTADIEIPALGFGTYQLEPDDARRMVAEALRLGYRHVDTAFIYGNEAGVGQGIADSGVARDRVFVTTKIWITNYRDGDLQRQAEESAQRLGQVPDLLLLHWPKPEPALEETIAALNDARARGFARNIGVSNFPSALFRRAAALSEAPLATNQVEYHPYLSQKTLIDTAHELGSSITAWSPLAQGRVADDPVIGGIAAAHGRTPGQVALRWIVQQGIVAIPKTASERRAAENLDIFDFELSDEQMARIHALAHPGGRIGDWIDPAFEWDQDASQR